MNVRRFALLALLALLPACSVPSGTQERPPAEAPRRVVSLSPAASEILSALGAANRVAGVTPFDRALPGLENVPLAGGPRWPDPERIAALRPDLAVLDSDHAELAARLEEQGVPVLILDAVSGGEANIRLLGRVMDRGVEAEALIAREEAFRQLAARKAARAENPPRVARFLGFADGGMLVPGDDSFQNGLIASAGGRPPVFGRTGEVIRISPEQWREFAPEAVYLCGSEDFSAGAGEASPWADVPAARAGRILAFPCELTDRAATHYGYFSLWLASEIHAQAFASGENRVAPDRVLSRKPLPLSFSHVAEAYVNEARLFDLPGKTLLLRFTGPQTVLSGLSGWKRDVLAVGNHYVAPPGWSTLDLLGMERANAAVLALSGLDPRGSVLMFTGADMDHLAYAEAEAEGLKVGVLATAGVLGNAMRASADAGSYVEPGTINLILLTNRELSPAAMTGAVIQATEAKTAALQDLDVRSSYSGLAATGTGTDNILVVSGSGPPAEMIGGHTKLGELLGKAVHQAVIEAVWKQNRLAPGRDVFRRLSERRIHPADLIERSSGPESPERKAALAAGLERLLLEPRYADFLLAALALSDSLERGLTADTGAFAAWRRLMADEVAGGPVENDEPLITDESVPPLVREALNSLIAGLRNRLAPGRAGGLLSAEAGKAALPPPRIRDALL